jgi:hypothetical protein
MTSQKIHATNINVFRTRYPIEQKKFAKKKTLLETVRDKHQVACQYGPLVAVIKKTRQVAGFSLIN